MGYDTANNKIQGWMKDIDLLWLFNTAKEMESVVEVGSWKGKSTHALLSGCRGTVYAVDHFLGSAAEPRAHAEAKTGDVHKIFMDNVGSFENLRVLKMDNIEAVKQFGDNSIDMVFIDAGHTYEEVLADIERWLPKTKKMICGHDIGHGPVKKAVNKLFGDDFEKSKDNIWIKRLNYGNDKADVRISPKTKYDLSILIPAKNEEFLKRTVEDILANVEGNTEIIIVLDGYEIELPKLPDDKRIRIINNPESKGQRAATNQACRLSEAKYIMKVDAHCAFDKGFDVKMMAEMKDDWTMIPTMRNLHVFNWVCKKGHARYQSPSGLCKVCGRTTVKDVVWIAKTNPQSTSYCFDQEPHFQYFNAFKKRPEGKGDLTETMSIQGSCFMLARQKYWDLNISDETLGSWGSQGIEVACKTWLSGGRVMVNHKTWYAHMFRTQGGDFGFPYENSGKKIEHAKKTVRELFFDNKWDKQIHPLSWLLERFWPVPGWSEEARAKIKAWPLPNQKGIQIPDEKEAPKPTVGILYYTDNRLNMKIARTVRRYIAASGLPVTSVTLKPTNFGQNIYLPLERGYLTMYKQILTGLEAMTEDIVFFAEHDTLYSPEYFKFMPADKNTFYYNGNYWFLRMSDGFAIHYNVSPLSGLVVYRETAVKHFKERVAMIEKDGFSYNMGFEPFTHGRIKWNFWCPFEVFMSLRPSIDIAHEGNVTKKRWSQDLFRRKPTFWEETYDEIPGWGKINDIIKKLT